MRLIFGKLVHSTVAFLKFQSSNDVFETCNIEKWRNYEIFAG